MGKVYEIAISENSKGEMQNVNSVEAIAGKGLIGDRHFKEDNKKVSQITLIEFENINHYNQIYGTSIKPINFRRNIITSGIKLNDLINHEILIGATRIKVHRLCDPCKYLQDILMQKNLVKNFINRGGLRCEVLTDGKISINDEITVI